MAQETLQLIITADNKDALKAIEDLAKSTAGLKTKFVENKGATDQATQSLVNLSRVAQDAPYGFIGIANNLNPLLESFQRLRATSTSNKEAFQSLLSVMTGPAGIGLALGVISSLVVAFGDKLFTSKKAVDEAKKAQEEYAKSLEKAKIAAIEQGLKLENLITLAQNANLTDAERVKALNGVKDVLNGVSKGYGDQIKNIDDAKEAVKQYTAALIQQAIVERYRNEIADKSIALAKTQESVTKARAQLMSSMTDAGKAPSSIGASMEIESASRMDKVTFAAKQLRDLKTQAILQANDILSVTNQMNSALEKGSESPLFLALMAGNGKLAGGGNGGADKLTEVQKVLKNLQETLNSAQFQLLNGLINEKGGKDSFAVQSLEAIYKAIEKIAGSKTQEAQNALKQLLGSAKELEDKYYSGKPQGDISDTSPVFRDTSFRTTDKYTGGAQKALDPLRTARNEMAINKMIAENDAEGMKKRKQAYENFADTVSGMATNAIMGFFDALKNGQDVVSALGDQFVRLAEDIAAMVIKAAIFEAIMASLNAGTGGGAGVVTTLFNIIPHAEGGITNGPHIGLVGEAGPEAIIPLSKLSGMLTQTFNAGSMSSGRGSSGGHFVLRGQDLLLATNRAQKASNLKGQSISLA